MRLVLTLSLTLALATLNTVASAASKAAPQAVSPRAPDSPTVTSAKSAIDRELIAPLASNEAHQSEYSRAYVPPRDRTARILDEKPRVDADGRSFLTFAVDESRGGSSVRKNTISGCVYPDSGKVFVGRDDSFFPAGLLLGKKVDAVAGACKVDASASRATRGIGWLAAIRASL